MRVPALLAAALIVCSGMAGPGHCAELTSIEQLGKALFFDASLSNPPGQSCATCHDPATGWTGHDAAINAAGAVEPGVVFTRSGNRKPPTVAYGGYTPILHQCMGMGGGGMGGGG